PTPTRSSRAERASRIATSEGAPIRLRLAWPLPGSAPVRELPSARIDLPKLLRPSWGRSARAPLMCPSILVGPRRASQPSWLKLAPPISIPMHYLLETTLTRFEPSQRWTIWRTSYTPAALLAERRVSPSRIEIWLTQRVHALSCTASAL